MKLIIVVMMIAILVALGSGLYFILFQRDQSVQGVKALTFRIGLSLLLFIGLFIAFALGWVSPHGLITTNIQTQKETTTPHPQNANTRPPLQNQNGG